MQDGAPRPGFMASALRGVHALSLRSRRQTAASGGLREGGEKLLNALVTYVVSFEKFSGEDAPSLCQAAANLPPNHRLKGVLITSACSAAISASPSCGPEALGTIASGLSKCGEAALPALSAVAAAAVKSGRVELFDQFSAANLLHALARGGAGGGADMREVLRRWKGQVRDPMVGTTLMPPEVHATQMRGMCVKRL